MSSIKLVAIDLDGTLLTTDKSLSARNIDAIKQCAAQDIRIVIATTRGRGYVRRICDLLELHDPIVCSTGAEVLATPIGPVWAYHTIPLAVAQAIVYLADAHDWYLSTTVGTMRYWRQRSGQALGLLEKDVTIVDTNIAGLQGEPVRILAWEPEAIKTIHDRCQQQFSGDCRTEIFYNPQGVADAIAVVAVNADKGTALQLVLEKLKIDPNNMLAIGDNNNDLPMFRVAGTAVAMGNALDNIKQQADHTAPDNDHDGVAWALERYVL